MHAVTVAPEALEEGAELLADLVLAACNDALDRSRELAAQLARNPPLSVRSTVRTRRWYMERATREAQFIAAPFQLYLTEDFQEAARAFTEKRPPRPFKGR